MVDDWRQNIICPLCKRAMETDTEKYSNVCGICTIERITGKPFIPWEHKKEEVEEVVEKIMPSNGNSNLDSFNNEGD